MVASVNFEEFKWFTPIPKNPLRISIPNLQSLRLSPMFKEEVPQFVEIGVSDHGRTLCIREKQETGYRVSNNSIKANNLIQHLVNAGIHLPAKYSVTKEDCCWIAKLEPANPPTIDMTRTPPRRKVRDMTEFMKEVSGL